MLHEDFLGTLFWVVNHHDPAVDVKQHRGTQEQSVRIVFLVSSMDIGGAERVATALCNAWAARGDQVTLVPTFSGCGHSPFEFEISSNVDLVYLADLVGTIGITPSLYLKRLWTLRTLMKEKKPDVVISFLPNVNVAAILSALFLSVPVICCERRETQGYCQQATGIGACSFPRFCQGFPHQISIVHLSTGTHLI